MTPARATDRVWGVGSRTSSGLFPGTTAQSVLELFMVGGMGQFESFYVRPDHGLPDDPDHPGEQWHLFADRHAEVFTQQCGLPEARWLAPFALDHDGQQVHLGPLVDALRARPDMLARTRVLVRRHHHPIHALATPLALTGRAFGDPRATGLGAHVARHLLERDGQTAPASFVIGQDFRLVEVAARPATATGGHTTSVRPIYFAVQPDRQILDKLARQTIGDHAEAFDALVAFYGQRARARYPLRAPRLDNHLADLAQVTRAPELAALLDPADFAAFQGEFCSLAGPDPVSPALRAAVGLLRAPTVRHVTVLNTALTDETWDSHVDHITTQSRAWQASLAALAAQVNAPGEADPTKLDLDRTMVVINTEFGRTPYRQATAGTNHWPDGYVSVLIGGAITPDQAGVFGAIGSDGRATHAASPAEERAAILAAMGIYPFETEAFDPSEVQALSTGDDALAYLTREVLGWV